MDKNSGKEVDVEAVTITDDDSGTENYVVIIPRPDIQRTRKRSRSNSTEQASHNNRQEITNSQGSSTDRKIILQPGTSVNTRARRRGSYVRRSCRFSGVKEHGSGAETNRVWPDVRRGTSKSRQLEYVEKVIELDRTSRDGILVTITDRGHPDVPARVEHYEYWKVRNSRGAMKDYFDSYPNSKADWIRWNREFVTEAYKTEEEMFHPS